MIGAAVWMGSLSAWLGPMGMWLVLDWYFIPGEERMMQERFGEKYDSYRKKVRRWI
jgi:protein-S-isoprenylcysteine O-methyltransferase Ste14